MVVRGMIFQLADASTQVGQIEEALKWGQPSYLTYNPKSGTPTRLGLLKSGEPAVFVHCQTSLIAEIQSQFPDSFIYDGNRAAGIKVGTSLRATPMSLLIRRALTYHLRTAAT